MFYLRLVLERYSPHGTNNPAVFPTHFLTGSLLCVFQVSHGVHVSASGKERFTFTHCAHDFFLILENGYPCTFWFFGGGGGAEEDNK